MSGNLSYFCCKPTHGFGTLSHNDRISSFRNGQSVQDKFPVLFINFLYTKLRCNLRLSKFIHIQHIDDHKLEVRILIRSQAYTIHVYIQSCGSASFPMARCLDPDLGKIA